MLPPGCVCLLCCISCCRLQEVTPKRDRMALPLPAAAAACILSRSTNAVMKQQSYAPAEIALTSINSCVSSLPSFLMTITTFGRSRHTSRCCCVLGCEKRKRPVPGRGCRACHVSTVRAGVSSSWCSNASVPKACCCYLSVAAVPETSGLHILLAHS